MTMNSKDDKNHLFRFMFSFFDFVADHNHSMQDAKKGVNRCQPPADQGDRLIDEQLRTKPVAPDPMLQMLQKLTRTVVLHFQSRAP